MLREILDCFRPKYCTEVDEIRNTVKTALKKNKSRKSYLTYFDLTLKKFKDNTEVQKEIAEQTQKYVLEDRLSDYLRFMLLAHSAFETDLENIDVPTIKKFIKLVDSTPFSDESYESEGKQLINIAQKYKNSENGFNLVYEGLQEIQDQLLDARVLIPETKKKYINLASYINLERFTTETNNNLITHIIINYLKSDSEKKLNEYLKKDNEWINQQKPEQIIPLMEMNSRLEETEIELKKETSNYTLNKICIAYDIARKNRHPETNETYLEPFYAGLQDTLATDYENIGKWCDTIIDGLKEVARTGQSLDEVMSR
ncbi:hypothetical protein HOK51_03110 [Candidatus Woesearchaeota archaeon]|jgi:hypothetical protein|nr:hypothetical protein [Candidatus Woesearchaeota archaeon]MBT6518808.1 hypothetical protein [Candidatus Woesearchaeota archaeon]MBT7367947.1 hypothetical protein [Candidatus Woesearchaeota archaeon]